ncbi:small lysine-rich protein 1 [Copidosoma floridanum]|uniref:small lysine-rich protein 1 n=1 Tax=Copidosoma floridanum TaxID=29053 RepID=UPI0006C98BA0|nr:small lysine-rich protein 1 [Copidosoma floridanum]
MPDKGKKKAGTKKNGKNGNGKAAKKSRSSRRSANKSGFPMDVFSEEAMENAYYTCHNIMDVLYCRGFPWPDAQKKKKKGRK